MKIEHLDIINYKSIKELHVDLNPRINVFIGANNVGKSNIMAAMEYLLGPTYPVPNRLDKSDFYNGRKLPDFCGYQGSPGRAPVCPG